MVKIISLSLTRTHPPSSLLPINRPRPTPPSHRPAENHAASALLCLALSRKSLLTPIAPDAADASRHRRPATSYPGSLSRTPQTLGPSLSPIHQRTVLCRPCHAIS